MPFSIEFCYENEQFHLRDYWHVARAHINFWRLFKRRPYGPFQWHNVYTRKDRKMEV